MTYGPFETILLDIDAGVGTLTLNRPEKRNAMNMTMQREFFDTMWQLDSDEDIRAIVVTGAGKSFCAGYDLESGEESFGKEAHASHDDELDVNTDSIAELASFWRMDTPIIGALNGSAIGAGLTLPLLFDVCYVAADAKLSFPFTRFGVVPDANSNWLVPRLVGLSRGLELLLSGRMFTGEEAATIGLVAAAHETEAVLPAAQALARDIAQNTSPASVMLVKRLVYGGLEETDRLASMQRETRIIWWLGEQADAREGLGAMLARRPPKWTLSKHTQIPDSVASGVTG